MKPTLLFLFFSFFFYSSFSQQYTINGNAASQGCNCYQLTKDLNDQSGSVWNNNQINLNNSFDYNFDVYLGSNDGGADGMAFVLQPISTSVGSSGGGMGYSGISPSVGITLDTYQNSSPDSDPFYDHITIQRNGDINHASANNLAGPVQASSTSTNIEDAVTHKLRVVWDALTKTMTTYFDGVQRLTYVNDFVNSTFGGNPMVFWGFTAATGGLSNEQRFCTALTPAWTFSPTQTRCVGEPIQFMNASISFTTIAKMYWNFGDGSNIDSLNLNPIHTYSTAGTYTVTQLVRGADGCEATNTQTVIVGSKPIASFTVMDTCINNNTQFTSTSTATIGTINNWYWELDGTALTATSANPSQVYNTYGIKNIRLAVTSLQGCTSDTIAQTIRIRSLPVANFTFVDSLCLGSTYTFTSTSTNADGLPVNSFRWQTGSTVVFNTTGVFTETFSTAGNQTVTLIAFNGSVPPCANLITKNVFVVDKPRAAIKTFRGCEDIAVTLQDSSYTLDGLPVTYWWWDLGNGNFSSQQNPTLTYNTAGPVHIQLVVWNSKGCKSDTLQTTIIISSKPIAVFSNADSCAGNTIQFTDLSSTGNITGWHWNFDNGGAASILQNPTTTYSTAGVKNIKFLVRNSDGCNSDTLFKPIRIFDKPTVDFTFTDSICLGTTINFTGAVISSLDPITNWQWTFDGSNSASTQNTSHTFFTAGSHTATLQASTTGAASCNGVIVQKNVFVIDKPRSAIRKFMGCEGVATQLLDSSYTLDGLAITSWWWDLGNGQFSTQQNPPVTYSTPGIVNIQLVVWNSKGCKSDTLKTSVKVYAIPAVDFNLSSPECNNNIIRFTDISTADTTLTGWSWSSQAAVFSTLQNPSHTFNPGSNTVSLKVTSGAGCMSATTSHSFIMKTKPVIAMDFDDACKFDQVNFSAAESGTNIGLVSWHWNFGDGTPPVIGNPVTHTYTANSSYPVKLYATSTEGCSSDTITRPINIYGTDAFAGNDIIAAANQPIQLNATGGLSYQWTPSTGLSATNIPNPLALNNVDRIYYLRAFTPEGCESFDTIEIKIYKGPDIYVPTAFTPNGDGRNDILKPVAVGITSFEYFAVYNRYGQLLFKSSNPNAGWDGRIKGKDQNTGSYVWMVAAVDFRGNKIFKKGTVLLIK